MSPRLSPGEQTQGCGWVLAAFVAALVIGAAIYLVVSR